MYIREPELRRWIRTKVTEGKPNIYTSTVKGQRMADTRN